MLGTIIDWENTLLGALIDWENTMLGNLLLHVGGQLGEFRHSFTLEKIIYKSAISKQGFAQNKSWG
jgi:hypothetical protein